MSKQFCLQGVAFRRVPLQHADDAETCAVILIPALIGLPP